MLYKMTDTTDQYTRKLKYNAFMGTIAVCIIYAIVAFAMLLYINLTEQGKQNIIKFLEELDEEDDVQNIFTNALLEN